MEIVDDGREVEGGGGEGGIDDGYDGVVWLMKENVRC